VACANRNARVDGVANAFLIGERRIVAAHQV